MNHLPFAITAYLLNGISVTVDKFLLTKHVPDPLIYVFYFSLVSLLAAFALPFVSIPSTEAITLASFSTILWTAGAYFLFKALKVGQVSRVIPIVGTLNPLILFAVASLTESITKSQGLAILFLISGIVFMTASDWKGKFDKKEFLYEILSASLFAISYLILREAYLRGDFLAVFVWSRPVLIPLGVILLVLPFTRKLVLNTHGPKINFLSRAGLLFIVGQVSGGISELLLIFAVSLANPAVVNSLQGVQYAFLFIVSLILAKKFPTIFKEKSSLLVMMGKVFGIGLIIGGLYLLAISGGGHK